MLKSLKWSVVFLGRGPNRNLFADVHEPLGVPLHILLLQVEDNIDVESLK